MWQSRGQEKVKLKMISSLPLARPILRAATHVADVHARRPRRQLPRLLPPRLHLPPLHLLDAEPPRGFATAAAPLGPAAAPVLDALLAATFTAATAALAARLGTVRVPDVRVADGLTRRV